MPTADSPTISVVIAWVNPFELLTAGLDALLQQVGETSYEIIVATRHDSVVQERLRAAYPRVSVLPAPAGTTIPVLRSMAIRHARGKVVAVTEDHCVPCSDWVSTIERRMRDGCGVVGGPVENGCTRRLRDWAAFLTDYPRNISPVPDGPATELPSNNVAYRHELLAGLCANLDRGLWESFHYEDLRRRGVSIRSAPEMVVYHRRPFDFLYFMGQRYHFCRSFAGMRCQFFTTAQRIKYAAASILLPPLLLLRGLRVLLQKRRFVGRYLLCLPLIIMYVSAGTIGELLGYLLGGGNSLARVE